MTVSEMGSEKVCFEIAVVRYSMIHVLSLVKWSKPKLWNTKSLTIDMLSFEIGISFDPHRMTGFQKPLVVSNNVTRFMKGISNTV